MIRPRRRKRKLPVSFKTVALSFVSIVAVFPTNLSAFLASKSNTISKSQKITSNPLFVTSLQNNNNSDESSISPSIQQANDALKQLDVQSAEAFLMTAVAEVNGAVMNNPPLLKCFESLFRTKIQIAQDKAQDDTVAYAIAQDRMGLASLLTDQSKYQEAADELELAVISLSSLPTSPNQQLVLDNASSLLFRTRAMVCDWDQYSQASDSLVQSTQAALSMGVPPAVHPFEALAWPCLTLKDATSIAHQYGNRAMTNNDNTNYAWTDLETRLPRLDVPFVRAITQTHDSNPTQQQTIKVGYLSPDFTGRHPLAFLMQDVFRFHDTSNFDIILYSLGGAPDGSPEVNHIVHGRTSDESSRTWKTLEGSVQTMAQSISDDQLDVVIDLCGYTGTSLVAEVMACLKQLATPPIHVAYMGFPGSSGAPYMDYMIADPTVIPSKFRPWYTENILYMPHCYFVNSHWHIKANQHPEKSIRDRDYYGLPPSPAFVFCCHSRPDKIDPSTFVTWIKAVQRTRAEGRATANAAMANSVLWLLRSKGAPQMEGNLLKVAKTILGPEIDEAIVVCDQAPRDEHLERLALADLYLDTPAYNAHTVGCDCLSAGVPMISLLLPLHDETQSSSVPTEKLASRVGSSLLQSAATRSSRLTDILVVSSMQEYEDRMVECASGASFEFAALQQLLLDEFDTAPLWDTERWVRNLETGLTTMVDLKRQGTDDTDIYVMDYT